MLGGSARVQVKFVALGAVAESADGRARDSGFEVKQAFSVLSRQAH